MACSLPNALIFKKSFLIFFLSAGMLSGLLIAEFLAD
jgi:hypothetical protein